LYLPVILTNISIDSSNRGKICSLKGYNALFDKYYINSNIIYYLRVSNFDELLMKANSAEKGTVLKSLSVALEWLVKSRTNEELENRFLFQFTALESLYSIRKESDKTATIAKYSSRLLSDYDGYENIESELTRLYDIRSDIVHDGYSDKLKMECCTRLERIVEDICIRILELYIGYTTKDFHGHLDV